MDENTQYKFSSGKDIEDSELSADKDKYQLEGTLSHIPRTNPFSPEDVQLLTNLFGDFKKEATESRKTHPRYSLKNTKAKAISVGTDTDHRFFRQLREDST